MHLIQGLLASFKIHGMSNRLQEVVKDAVLFSCPPFIAKAIVANIAKNAGPSPSLLRHHLLTLDMSITMILRRRSSDKELGDCFRYMLTDSSPQVGYDWLWCECCEIARHRVIPTFFAVISVSQAITTLATGFAGDASSSEIARAIMVNEDAWVDDLQMIRDSLFFVIPTPVALGVGHRSLSDKAAHLSFAWSLNTANPVQSLFRQVVSHTSDMGVEQGLPDFHVKSADSLLPSWQRQVILMEDDTVELLPNAFKNPGQDHAQADEGEHDRFVTELDEPLLEDDIAGEDMLGALLIPDNHDHGPFSDPTLRTKIAQISTLPTTEKHESCLG